MDNNIIPVGAIVVHKNGIPFMKVTGDEADISMVIFHEQIQESTDIKVRTEFSGSKHYFNIDRLASYVVYAKISNKYVRLISAVPCNMNKISGRGLRKYVKISDETIGKDFTVLRVMDSVLLFVANAYDSIDELKECAKENKDNIKDEEMAVLLHMVSLEIMMRTNGG